MRNKDPPRLSQSGGGALCIFTNLEGLVVADGDTKEILQDEKFLNEHGLEKPQRINLNISYELRKVPEQTGFW